MQLLIYSCQDDLHVDAVIRNLASRRPDIGVIRVNSDNLATNTEFCFHWSSVGEFRKRTLRLVDSGVSSSDVAVIWYRKPGIPNHHPALVDPNAQQCSSTEYRELLRALPGLFPSATWVNDYWQMQRYSIKANQISIARHAGLSIPETVISNDIDVIRDLAKRHGEIIVKPLAYTGFVINERQYSCFTSPLTLSDLAQFRKIDLDFAPAIFQQRINKVQELRVTVIGSEVYACEIQTLPHTLENIDWRIDGIVDLPHRIVDIPQQIADSCIQVLDLMHLRFGAFDIIKDDSDTYYFLEVNPNGQYYWIELLTGAPLTEAMTSLIIGLCEL